MKKSKAAGFAAMGLAAGLVLGSIGIAGATTLSKTTTSTATAETADTMRGPDGAHGPGGRGGFGGLGDIPEAIENLTDLSVDQVMTKREAGTSFAAIAKAEGVSESALIAETVKIEKAELAAAVKAGTLTAAEQTQILKDIESNLKTAVESTDAMRGPGGPGDAHGPGGRGGFGGLGDIPEAIENLTDLSVDQVMTKREAGTSFAAIAKAEGVSESALIAETVRIEKAELAAAVKAGTLTAAEQTQILKDIESNLKTAVESTDAMRGPGGHGHRGPLGGSESQSSDGSTTR